MEKFTIECVGYNEEDVIVLEHIEQHKHLEIRCSGIEDNNSFTMEYYGDEGIIVTRNRCKLDVYLSENKTYYDRNYTIICTHANDANVFVQINLLQKAEEFALNIMREEEVTLQSIVDSSNSVVYNGDEMYYEEQTIDLKITGGSKKYRVVGIYKCYDEEDIVYKLPFDNGFILEKNIDNIVIRNYGRPFFEDKYYYTIVLQHFDVREIEKELKIIYSVVDEKNVTRSSKLLKSINKTPSKPMIISPILKKTETDKEVIEEIKTVEYKLELLDDIEDYTIIGEPVETILPFKVTEDDIESNLMVQASSSAYWCRVKVIQEYNENNEIERKLIFRITNKPLIVRKTKITVSIIDLPYINISFILTNKPS